MNLNEIHYHRFYSKTTLTSKDIEEGLKSYNLITEFNIGDSSNDFELPMFVPPFHTFIDKQGILLDQEMFWGVYQNTYYKKIKTLDSYDLSRYEGRVKRAYLSLMRDLHFFFYLKERLTCDVVYSIRLDTEYDIDVLLIHNGINYGVRIFTATENGIEGRRKKINRSIKLEDVVYLDVQVQNIHNANVGEIILLGELELGLVRSLINL